MIPTWLETIRIQTTPVLTAVYVVAVATATVLLVPRVGVLGRGWRRAAWTALALGVGALAGWLAVWQVVDVQDAFGAPASDVIRGAACAAGAVIALAVVNLVRTRAWRKVVAAVAAVSAVLAAGLMINRDVAYYPDLGAVFGDTGVHGLAVSRSSARDASASMPAVGRLGTVRIPGTVSGFRARDAWVYLPPAAVSGEATDLPVLVLMSGEPGGPSDVFLAGDLKPELDAVAAAHHGIAPIVVVPDQLGGYDRNPMCVDSPMGHVATYITVDVRRWILANLPAATSRSRWAIGGFSEGGTCAAQFGTAHPDLFGAFIAVSPERGPFDHSVATTVREAFHGDRALYRAAFPIATMRTHGRYTAMTAVYAVGSSDRRYGKVAPAMAAESRRVGMRTTFTALPGLAHNWNTGAAGLSLGIRTLMPAWAGR